VSTDIVIWSGPVNASQVPGATVPGATDRYIPCVGDVQPGKANCPALANGWLDGSGRRLPRLLESLGYSEDQVGNIYLGAFSAGGSIVKRLLEHPADRARIRAVLLADASYSSGGTPAHPEPVEGYVRYALDLLADPTRYFLATASASPNKNYGSGAQVLGATREEIERRSGVAFVPGGSLPVPPDAMWSTPGGNVVFADYGMQGGGHGFHPQIAPRMWQEVLVPWLDGTLPPPVEIPPVPPSAPPPPGRVLLILLAGAGIGYGLWRLYRG
jgi:hypothetical protein